MSESERAIATAAFAKDGWRIVAASVRGPAHVARDRPREDAFAVGIVSRCALAVVCDGAGSAPCAAAGAAGFSASVMQALATAMQGGSDNDDLATVFQQAVANGIDRQRTEILRQGLCLSDHHATLMAVAMTPSRTLIAHLGDGLVGIAADADWADAGLSLPENGEFANETFFVTEDGWHEHLRFLEGPSLQPGGVAVLLTDGAMPFVVGRDQIGLEPDFMGPVSRFLGSAELAAAGEALAGTLDSADARRISSDDKTLVWIAPDAGLNGMMERLSWSP